MEQLPSADAREPTFLRRFFPIYCALTALIIFGYALWDGYQLDGDAVAYMDIGDCLRAHQWGGIVNAYWHPMYPAFLSVAHILFHATLATELHAYYMANYVIFLLEMLAILCFTDSLIHLRTFLGAPEPALSLPKGLASEIWESRHKIESFLLTKYPLRYLGIALLVIASQRELSLGKVRPDALLQAFILFGIAALLTHLATGKLRYAGLMGLALGCAYLTKSFAFVLAFLCIATLAAFRWIWLRHKPAQIIPATLIALLCFAAVAGPYVAALSRQKGRLDFGDSGALNYAWYVGGTEKMHLEPYMSSRFGSADVHLKHPERELLHSPQVVSYAELPYGTYPAWFDTTYWNDQIKPHFRLRDDIPRVLRNCELVVRYLLNHPEALLLLAVLIFLGARLTLPWKPGAGTNAFWLPPVLLGALMWGIYGVVNTEERYVTVAFLAIILTLFATLRLKHRDSANPLRSSFLPTPYSLLPLFLALLATGESLRTVLEDRRQLSGAKSPGGWYNPSMVQAAHALNALGVHPGDPVACVGEPACLADMYWARLAGVRILTEVYDPDQPVYPFLAGLTNRDQVIGVVRAQGAKVLVGDFGTIRATDLDPEFNQWHQLAGTTYYALPLNLPDVILNPPSLPQP
jgi:hypothetical protein